jgi:hypothetical protein
MDRQDQINRDENRDPITGEPGSHPVGSGLGAFVGGAATGAAAGAAGGPIAAGVGAVVGGLAGAFAGHELAEHIDPTQEEAYWRDEYRRRNYYDADADYERDVAPAYRFGWEARSRYQDRAWNDVEPDLRRDWETHRGPSSLEWNRAQPATRDAWKRIDDTVRRGATTVDMPAIKRPKQ